MAYRPNLKIERFSAIKELIGSDLNKLDPHQREELQLQSQEKSYFVKPGKSTLA